MFLISNSCFYCEMWTNWLCRSSKCDKHVIALNQKRFTNKKKQKEKQPQMAHTHKMDIYTDLLFVWADARNADRWFEIKLNVPRNWITSWHLHQHNLFLNHCIHEHSLTFSEMKRILTDWNTSELDEILRRKKKTISTMSHC